MKILIFFLALYLFMYVPLLGQVNYTANNHVIKYDGAFSYGTNGGYYPTWSGDQIRDIFFGNPSTKQSGASVTGIRYTLPNHFVERWNYDINIEGFKKNKKAGALDNVCFLEGPSDINKSLKSYCGVRSLIFKDIDLPIWDNNYNTPINENNPYALYVFKTVSMYKDYVKFWEIWNEPDHTTSSHGWEGKEFPLSWWNKNPDPCDLDFFVAPIQSYVRLLRISYEVMKFVDPTAYVTTGGIGYESFLDAILRNTDNPDGGKVTDQFPLTGGAYFDVLSFHSYPQYGLTNNRHSDGAVNAITEHKLALEKRLRQYGYDGKKYPAKEFIITEFNLSRKTFDKDFGSEEAQKNFILKASTAMQSVGIRQMYIYGIAERRTLDKATQSYDLMGLYEDLNAFKPFTQKLTTEGIAFSTASKILYKHKLDIEATKLLNLPPNIGGGAFKDNEGKYTYVLWSKTIVDQSEKSVVQYSFPDFLKLNQLEKRQWNYSSTREVNLVASKGIELTSTPVFLNNLEKIQGTSEENANNIFNCYVLSNPSSGSATLTYNLLQPSEVSISIIDVQGHLIKKFENKQIMEGSYQLNLETDNLNAGIYFCKFQTILGSSLLKIVVIK